MEKPKIKNNPGKLKPDEWIGRILIVSCLFFAAAAIRLCFSRDIWYDELFTMGFAGQSYGEIVGYTARDVHPPFYYMYIKTAIELCKLIIPSAEPVVIGKLCSVLPYLLLLIYAIWKVRKYFGMLCAGIFSFCVFSMPQLSQYMTEIRMYSLSLFLVTAALLHGYGTILSVGKKKTAMPEKASSITGQPAAAMEKGAVFTNTGGMLRENMDWLLLTLYGILAAYTHYFACVAAAMIYLCLLCWYFIMKPGRAYIKKWGLCVFVSALCYIPWLFTVISQVRQVKESYWILPLTLRSVGGCVKFLLKPSFADGTVNVLAAVLLFMVYGFLVLWAFAKEKKRKQENLLAVAGLFVLAGLTAFGFAASFLLRPVFIYRYMLPAVGAFWLCFSIFLNRFSGKKAVLFPVLLLLLIVGITDFKYFYNDETWKREQMCHIETEISAVRPDDAVIFNFNQLQGNFSFYLDNEMYLWMDEPETLIGELFENCKGLNDVNIMKEWLADGRTVWFAGSGNAREDVLGRWQAEGITCTEQEEGLLERYWFKLYRLSMEK